MKQCRLFLILILFLLPLLSACGGHDSDRAELERIDSLASNRQPVRALELLDSIDARSLSEPNRNLYDLLRIKARDKNFQTHRSNETILRLVAYYRDHQSEGRYPEALYYAGRVHSDLGDYPSALKYFYQSLDQLNEGEEDNKIKSLVNGQIGDILKRMRLYNQAIPYLEQSLNTCYRVKDSLGILFNEEAIGCAFLHNKDLNSRALKTIFSTDYQYINCDKIWICLQNFVYLHYKTLQINDMITRSDSYQAPSLFSGLSDMLDHGHPLFQLSERIDWKRFDDAFEPLFCQDNGRPAKSVRLMTGLLILKHVRDISDESVVDQWRENPYYQYFCGMSQFSVQPPCAATELVHFRKRIGEKGVELILQESIRVNDDDDRHSGGRGRRPEKETTAFIDSTVQEKNITFPTDAKLLLKTVNWCLEVARKEHLVLRQTYRRELKGLKMVMRFRGKAKSRKAVAKADRRLRTIAGRLCRELDRLLPSDSPWRERLDVSLKFVNGERIDGHKIYSLHEPDVLCIAKGKDHVKYEFGNKVSIVRTWDGLIIGALSFRNEYDGHTIDASMEQVRRIYPHPIKRLGGDRGYRGQRRCGDTDVEIPSVPSSSDSPYRKRKKHDMFCKRAGIEPVIGHLKSDHRLSRNFYKGLFGDSINVMLAAAAFNFKRAMRALFRLFSLLYGMLRMLSKPNMSEQSGKSQLIPCLSRFCIQQEI